MERENDGRNRINAVEEDGKLQDCICSEDGKRSDDLLSEPPSRIFLGKQLSTEDQGEVGNPSVVHYS